MFEVYQFYVFPLLSIKFEFHVFFCFLAFQFIFSGCIIFEGYCWLFMF
jgi:hypothetical protein